ncbi:hypothetical protein TraAM80_05844 [Trypanosoma rangeli]|uniref:Clathrin light chain n=1 Tax=Trypanosoma rangeli TaxID=5698 RepID=A0A422NCU7_TRYRA|nr:uncharacterized protein TraAM80_05844 [Trypanosoma rangeli]RNF03327.1 hypothetical protein TraAM80_05844 [Trypanosoma rangeli]|eukprot:RNF03327.1 hypothetical protein TraAM80_05844 [Trypanosoma rangeli]
MDFLEDSLPQPKQDVNSVFGDVDAPTQTTATEGAAAAWPAHVPPEVLQGSNTDDFLSGDRASLASPIETETNGYGVTEAVQKEIEKRTQDIDAESKKKADLQTAAAESYMRQVKVQHETMLKERKSENMQQQKSNEAMRNEFKKNGAVWNSVGLMTDLNKANKYSKSTERMRTILKKLNDTNQSETSQP